MYIHKRYRFPSLTPAQLHLKKDFFIYYHFESKKLNKLNVCIYIYIWKYGINLFKLFSIRLNSTSTRYQMSPADSYYTYSYSKIPSKSVRCQTSQRPSAETLITKLIDNHLTKQPTTFLSVPFNAHLFLSSVMPPLFVPWTAIKNRLEITLVSPDEFLTEKFDHRVETSFTNNVLSTIVQPLAWRLSFDNFWPRAPISSIPEPFYPCFARVILYK